MNDHLRQIELLALIRNGARLSKADWADKYAVSEITINRDLRALRSLGLQIYSKSGQVILKKEISEDLSLDLIATYISHSDRKKTISKKLHSSLSKKEEVFSYLILLSKAIREKLKVEAKYKRFYDNREGDYSLKPIFLEVEGLNWTLNALKEGEQILKTFYIQRIESLNLTSNKYRLSQSFSRSQKLYDIVLKFHPDLRDHVHDKIWFNIIEYDVDYEGYIILKTQHPITNRLAAWCITWGDAIEIISPKELKDHTNEMIENFKKTNT